MLILRTIIEYCDIGNSGCGVAHTVATQDSGARGPGFDATPKLRMAFSDALISLLSDNRLKNNFHSFVILWCQVEINYIIKYYKYYYNDNNHQMITISKQISSIYKSRQ